MKLKNKIFFTILTLIILTSLSYLVFLLQISEDILKAEVVAGWPNMILIFGSAITLLTMLIAFLTSGYLAGQVISPITKLTQVAQAIGQRDFRQQLKLHSYSEINQLILSFNRMAEQLQGIEQRTKRHRQNLETIARERTKELSYIYKISREISSTLELDQVLDTISKRTRELLGLKICTILLVDQDGGERLQVAQAQGINVKKIEKQPIKKGEGLSGWVWSKREALLVKELDQDSRFIGRKKEKYYSGSLICVPLEAEGKIIGVIIGNNKVSGKLFKKDDLLLLREIAIESAIAIENARLYKSLKQVYLHTISALARAVEAKDRYTRSHSENVTRYAMAIASDMGLLAEQVELIGQACQLHDIGKIAIHDYILTKRDGLSSEEWDEVKRHALRGAQILQPIGFLNEVADLVCQHHERYDGTGYPSRLKGGQIHLGARIMAAADSFDAMISERPYRKALSLSRALEELRSNSGSQFDPAVVEVFLKTLSAHPNLIERPS